MNHDQQERAALEMIALDLERLKRMADERALLLRLFQHRNRAEGFIRGG